MRLISHYLDQELQDIFAHAKKMLALSDEVKKYLPPHLIKHFAVSNFNKGCLLLNTNNAVWASELRYYLPTLRDQLRKKSGLYQLTNIKIIVVNHSLYEPTKKKFEHHLSSVTRGIIYNAGTQCNYKPLRDALYKLANTETSRS